VKPKTIVSVLEASSAANDAPLARALSLAKYYASDLHVVDVRPASRAGDDGDATRNTLLEQATVVAHASGAGGVRITPSVLSGTPIGAIAEYSSRVAANLVVVGRQARRRNGYWSAGSFAAALGKEVKAPTIAVPSGAVQPARPGAPFRNILSAIDFSDASFRALSESLSLARQNGAHLRLLHVLEGFPYETVYSGSRALRLIEDLRTRVGQVNRKLLSLIPLEAFNWSDIEVATVSGQAHRAIVSAAAERRTDLIVLGLPLRSRLEQLVAGSTVHRVLRRATAPVLLVPAFSTAGISRSAATREGAAAWLDAA
jgi:nucleotide-binding universal stress UspA family protein